MATVWKFPIKLTDNFSIEMPRDAEILFVSTQLGEPFLWARVVPGRHKEMRHFKLRGTGDEVDTGCKHIGSFMLNGGMLVFHLFEAEA